MTIKFIGNTTADLTNGKLYEVISIERGWYRILTDYGEDYLFPPEYFEIVSNDKTIQQIWFFYGGIS